jgi:flagellar motor switch protein FliN
MITENSPAAEPTATMPGVGSNFGMLADIAVRLSVEVGSTAMPLYELMELAEGTVVELDRQANELLDIMANGTLIAKGEVVTIGSRFGIRIVEIVNGDARWPSQERRR